MELSHCGSTVLRKFLILPDLRELDAIDELSLRAWLSRYVCVGVRL